jgi:hypothetical protein
MESAVEAMSLIKMLRWMDAPMFVPSRQKCDQEGMQEFHRQSPMLVLAQVFQYAAMPPRQSLAM